YGRSGRVYGLLPRMLEPLLDVDADPGLSEAHARDRAGGGFSHGQSALERSARAAAGGGKQCLRRAGFEWNRREYLVGIYVGDLPRVTFGRKHHLLSSLHRREARVEVARRGTRLSARALAEGHLEHRAVSRQQFRGQPGGTAVAGAAREGRAPAR